MTDIANELERPAQVAHADICIIGAGSSGVTVAKHLQERGLAFDCFERGSEIGGMWRYENDNGASCCYQSLHIDTSRDNLGYSDFPIPKDRPDFLSHADFLRYLEDYADRFGLRDKVAFGVSVEGATPTDDGGWRVRLSTGETRAYRTVIVANGHLWDPRWPEFPGTFDGLAIHARDYRTPAPFEGKDVLVVGFGNSAVDIAVDLSRRAKSVAISTRRGAWVMPKYLMGIPVDRWSGFFSRKLRLPTQVTRAIMARLIRLAVGDQRRFGIPRPPHPMWREHATLTQDLMPCIGHGYVTVKPDVAKLDGDGVVFSNGERAHFDAIIYATGYRTTFPFLAPDVFDGENDATRLYRRIVAPDRPGLYFAGLVQPIGPTIPLVEIQARWIAEHLSGAMRLPDRAGMSSEIEAHRERQRKTYLDSARYALEVDFALYARQMRDDMSRGSAGV